MTIDRRVFRRLVSVAFLLVAPIAAWADRVVTASASSSYEGRDPIQAVNQSGLNRGAHDDSLRSAWHSGPERGNCWFRIDLRAVQPIRWMKLWNFNWAPYTDRGVKQADLYWSAHDAPGNPIDNPDRWTLSIENQTFTRASHWPDYGRNRGRRMPDVIDLGAIKARFICLKIDSNFTKAGQGYFGISEIAFSASPFPDTEPIAEPLVDGAALSLTARPESIAGDQRFPAPAGGWDLSKYQFVEFELHNTSRRPATISCWVFAPKGWGGLGTCPEDSGVTFLEPGEEAKVRINLHTRFLGEQQKGFCKVIDASQISYAEIIYQLRPRETATPIVVKSIRAVGESRNKNHDISGRLFVPEVENGEPQPGKRVRKDLHVLYLPTDWERGATYPVIIEFPGNQFYNQFCYSPGKTEYGRLGWGLTRGLGDPAVAGDGFIWLNLPFVSDAGKEQISGWGNPEKTIDYCLESVAEVVEDYGGDPDSVVFTGFSRGSLAANYIGLRTPEIAGLVRAWHRTPARRAPAEKGGWHNMFVGHNRRIDRHYQGQPIFPRGVVAMGPRAHVDCGYLEDRPIALEGRRWLREVLADELDPLRNERYNVWPQLDGSLHVADVRGGGFEIFRPKFTAVFTPRRPASTRLKWNHPTYNLVAWKIGDELTADVFKIGEVLDLGQPTVRRKGDQILWTFDHEHVRLTATATLPPGQSQLRIDYVATFKRDGYFTLGYTGAPAIELGSVARLWQPLVWDGRRLPEQSFLIPDDHCSIPGGLVQRSGRPSTIGVMADPSQFPYEMPHSRNRKFGVTVRNDEGKAQPMVFAPFPGSNSRFAAGDRHRFRVQLVSRPRELSATFEHVAREICRFRDQRENTLTTLNQTLENMSEFALSEWAKFDTKNKSSYYPDAKGTVKNVSCLHPFGIAAVTDEPRFFHAQTVPIMEYLLSREKFLFAIAEEGLGHSQRPSMNLNGPAMPVSELAALYRMSRRSSPLFLEHAERLYARDRRLNMNWVTPGSTWQRSLSLYRATGDRKWLADASAKANRYIEARVNTAPTDFAETGDGTFFEYMVPWWKELYDLYLETENPTHLAAAHEGARRYAQFVWFYPSVPDRDVTVNPRGLAPRRGRAKEDGVLPTPKETVPAWRVSDQGLVCEGNGTAQRLGILIATHAPYFLRIANDTGDDFLRTIARSAVIGRYANFPGYHLNTRFSTSQEKPDFPRHPYETLKPTTSIHYNHILPAVSLVIDYLFARAYDLSNGAIDFPAEFAEGYAYLQGRVYGSRPGRFYDEVDVWPWMPRRLLRTDNVQVNYIAARGDDRLCLAFMNASGRPLKDVMFQLNPELLEGIPDRLQARVWRDNEAVETPIEIHGGQGTISLGAKGMTSLSIRGLGPKVRFQTLLGSAKPPTVENIGAKTIAGCKVEASVLCFGPSLRWLYVFLRSDSGKPDLAAVTLQIEMKRTMKRLADESFPHEFSVPIPEDIESVRFSLSTERAR